MADDMYLWGLAREIRRENQISGSFSPLVNRTAQPLTMILYTGCPGGEREGEEAES